MTILIVAGDPSGDLVASKLVKAIKEKRPELKILGIGGGHLKKVCDEFLVDIVSQHALGFAISFQKVNFFRRVLKDVIAPTLKTRSIDAVIPVDFHGFNCLVARTAKKAGSKVFYYVSPQFWASRPKRATRLKPFVDLFLCLFPFEVEFFKKKNIPAVFVGHPILDVLPLPAALDEKPRIENIVGMLPGSRPGEIKRHLPVMLKAAAIINKEKPGTRFLLFVVPNVKRDYYNSFLKIRGKERLLLELVQDENFEWRPKVDVALTASGMETLENTLLGIPMVVMYKTNWPTYLVAKSIVKIPHVAMPNVLAQKELVPEFLQWKATPKAIASAALVWLKNPEKIQATRSDLLTLRKMFGEGGASDRAASAILEYLK